MRAGRSHFTDYALLAEEILNILLLYCLSIIKVLQIHSFVNNQLYLRCYTLMAAPPKNLQKNHHRESTGGLPQGVLCPKENEQQKKVRRERKRKTKKEQK